MPTTEPAPREHVDRRELLGEQDRLTLRQHDHADGEPHAAGQRGEVGERDERLRAAAPRAGLSPGASAGSAM